MMWAIFCSLAFCAFQMVFAVMLEDDIFDSQNKLTLRLGDVQDKAYSYVEVAAKAVKIKQIPYYQIEARCRSTDFDRRFAESVQTNNTKCRQCYDEAKNAKDIPTAEKCCKKLISKLKKDAKLHHAQMKTCFAKCAQDTTKCSEEIENIFNAQMQEYPTAANDNTKKV